VWAEVVLTCFRYQLALDFFNEMHRDNVKPNVVTYNALIAACGQGGAGFLEVWVWPGTMVVVVVAVVVVVVVVGGGGVKCTVVSPSLLGL